MAYFQALFQLYYYVCLKVTKNVIILLIDRYNNKLYYVIRQILSDNTIFVGRFALLFAFDKEQDRLIELLTDELPVLRARLRISQDELSRRIGISRQTYSLIETKKQKMTWVTFMALIAFFDNNSKTKSALKDIGLTTDESFKMLLQK